MLFLLSLALATLPWLGIGYILFTSESLTAFFTVDNLFTTLMLALISGIFGLDVLYTLKENGWRPPLGKYRPAKLASVPGEPVLTPSGAFLESGIVESVGYFESTVGQPNRLVLTLRNNGSKPRVLVFQGDLRDQFPVGRRIAIKYRPEEEGNTLLERRFE
jgi:hypothetical protein